MDVNNIFEYLLRPLLKEHLLQQGLRRLFAYSSEKRGHSATEEKSSTPHLSHLTARPTPAASHVRTSNTKCFSPNVNEKG